MLTTVTPGNWTRQWFFHALLFVPILGLLFVLGVFMGRSTETTFPIVLGAAILATIATIVILGMNYKIGMYLIMFFVLWDRLLSFGEGGRISATKIAIGLTMIFMLTAILNNELPGWWRRLFDPVALCGTLFMITCILGLPFVAHPEIADEFLTRRLSCITLMLLIMIIANNRDVFHNTVLWLVIGGTLVAMATTSEAITGESLLQRFGKVPTVTDISSKLNDLNTYGGGVRLIGPSGDSTYYSIAQSLPGVLAVGLFLQYREWWKKGLVGIAIAFIVFNILGTGSRGGTMAFVAGVLVIFLTCPVKHRFAKLGFAAATGFVGLAAMVFLGAGTAASRVANAASATTTVTWRVAMWEMAFNMYKSHPLVGVGTNFWGVYYEFYRTPDSPSFVMRTTNSFMQIAAENGTLGVLSYLGIYLFAGIAAFTAGLGTRDRRLKFEAMAIGSTLIGFLLFAGTSNVLENELYYIVFGLCAAAYVVYAKERTLDPSVMGDAHLRLPRKESELRLLAARQAQMYGW